MSTEESWLGDIRFSKTTGDLLERKPTKEQDLIRSAVTMCVASQGVLLAAYLQQETAPRPEEVSHLRGERLASARATALVLHHLYGDELATAQAKVDRALNETVAEHAGHEEWDQLRVAYEEKIMVLLGVVPEDLLDVVPDDQV